MSDEVTNSGLKELGQLALDAEEESLLIHGGEAGGADKIFLKRSELRTLRQMTNCFPLTDQDRADTVNQVMTIVRGAKSKRLQLGGAKVVVAMQKANFEEVKTLIAAKLAGKNVGKQVNIGTQINVQINEQVVEKTVPVTPTITEEEVHSNGRDHSKNGQNLS